MRRGGGGGGAKELKTKTARIRFREKKKKKKKQSARDSLLEKVCQGSLRRAPGIMAVQTRGDGGHYSDRGVCQVC